MGRIGAPDQPPAALFSFQLPKAAQIRRRIVPVPADKPGRHGTSRGPMGYNKRIPVLSLQQGPQGLHAPVVHLPVVFPASRHDPGRLPGQIYRREHSGEMLRRDRSRPFPEQLGRIEMLGKSPFENYGDLHLLGGGTSRTYGPQEWRGIDTVDLARQMLPQLPGLRPSYRRQVGIQRPITRSLLSFRIGRVVGPMAMPTEKDALNQGRACLCGLPQPAASGSSPSS